jgi:hypothetical protein
MDLGTNAEGVEVTANTYVPSVIATWQMREFVRRERHYSDHQGGVDEAMRAAR